MDHDRHAPVGAPPAAIMAEAEPCAVAGLEPLDRRQAGKIDGGSRPRDRLQLRQPAAAALPAARAAPAPARRRRTGPISGGSRSRGSGISTSARLASSTEYRELCITEYMSSTRLGLAGMAKNPYVAATPPTPESVADACCRKPDQRARIHRLRTVLRPEADGGGRLWPCPRPRRNLRLPRAALLRPLLFRAEGRERQDRGGDLEIRPSPGCGSSRRKGSRSSPPASSRPIRARRNTRSSSRRWSPPASAR